MESIFKIFQDFWMLLNSTPKQLCVDLVLKRSRYALYAHILTYGAHGLLVLLFLAYVQMISLPLRVFVINRVLRSLLILHCLA